MKSKLYKNFSFYCALYGFLCTPKSNEKSTLNIVSKMVKILTFVKLQKLKKSEPNYVTRINCSVAFCSQVFIGEKKRKALYQHFIKCPGLRTRPIYGKKEFDKNLTEIARTSLESEKRK